MKRIRSSRVRLKRSRCDQFGPYKRTVCQILLRERRPLTTRKIANKSHMTWRTANSHLGSLKKEGYVKKRKTSNRTYWQPTKKLR